jgi:hypothetical protein
VEPVFGAGWFDVIVFCLTPSLISKVSLEERKTGWAYAHPILIMLFLITTLKLISIP